MIYLKPLIKKLAHGEENASHIVLEANNMENDRELLDYFLKVIGIEKIESVFKHHYGIEYANLNKFLIDEDAISQFGLNFLKRENMLPLLHDKRPHSYHFTISNLIERDMRSRIEDIAKSNGQNVAFYFSFEHEILDKFEELKSQKPMSTIMSNRSKDGQNFNVVEWVNGIINKGIELNSSDIHIERLESQLQIRYRVDGLLTNKEKYTFNANTISNIYVRLKVISNMDIAESRKSQDGRIDNYQHDGKSYDLRVSTVNTIHGEKFVLRLLAKSQQVASFAELGFSRENEEKVKTMLSNQNGIIYLAGATGSGKTTTLYSMIDQLNEDSVNIYTIENPVEKTIENVNQIQIDEASGTDYPTILSVLLRQDPNVIVVGEIRDAETANLSIRASLTGHLVLTTLHANGALDTLGRLSDMGMKSYLIGASSIGFISQRLVRQLCPHCKQKKEKLKSYEVEWIKEELPEFDYEAEKQKGHYVYKPIGCPECTGGYKGRIGVVEVLVVDDTLRSLISKGESMENIRKFISTTDYRSLRYDGIEKAIKGITSIEELIGQI